jgi:ornithine cyclodeaminase
VSRFGLAGRGVLAEVESGFPLLFSEFTLMTVLRTAATSALVAKALARPDARSMTLIGNGAKRIPGARSQGDAR